jgi:AcrR family transcriptional regulator
MTSGATPRSPGRTPVRRPTRGRRPAGADTRSEIVDAARRAFAEHGYDGASLRGIARAAGVDPSLVHHYFDGKAALFAETMEIGLDPQAVVDGVLAGDAEELGVRAVRTFFRVWDSPQRRPQLVALLRSAVTHEEAGRVLREFLAGEVFGRMVVQARMARDGGEPRATPEEQRRAGLAAAQMLGVAVLRYVVRLPALSEAPLEDLVPPLAATVQGYLVPRPDEDYNSLGDE